MEKKYERVSLEEMNNFTPEKKKISYTFFLWGKKFTTKDESLYNQIKSLKNE